jgi:cobalt-zinc-cadmium efflux system protein
MEKQESHCSHGHGHGFFHGHTDRKLSAAVFINLVLTLAQIIAGIFSGSLALIADALHNLSDAASLLLALIARKVSRRHADDKRTYGYKKVETLAAFANLLTLIIIGVWLAYEAVVRFFQPQEVEGWTVVSVAFLAILINGGTAWLTFHEAKGSQNIRAAFLHNLTDAISSVGVVVAGILILMFDWLWVDPLITLVISAYVLWYGTRDLPSIINILIDGAPSHVNVDHVRKSMLGIEGVADVHHLHIRYLNEHEYALEAHIVPKPDAHEEDLKAEIKKQLGHFHISHSTLEFERDICGHKECC